MHQLSVTYMSLRGTFFLTHACCAINPLQTNSDPQHLIDSNTHVAKAILAGKDQRALPGRMPPEPPQRVNSRLSPDKMTSQPVPPTSLPTSQHRSQPAPPTLYPTSPQTPLTPPTPQGPGPGPGPAGDSPELQRPVGVSQEDVFTRVSPLWNYLLLDDNSTPQNTSFLS